MIRYVSVGLILLGWASWGKSTTLEPIKPEALSLPPYAIAGMKADFAGAETARAICIGDGRSFMGLYVFDADGNCVARDDAHNVRVRDDLAAEWFPAAAGSYRIEIVNFGHLPNDCKLALK